MTHTCDFIVIGKTSSNGVLGVNFTPCRQSNISYQAEQENRKAGTRLTTFLFPHIPGVYGRWCPLYLKGILIGACLMCDIC